MSSGSDWVARQLAARRAAQQPQSPSYGASRTPSYYPQPPAGQSSGTPTGYPPPQIQGASGRVVTSEDLSSTEGVYRLMQQSARDGQRTERCPECNKNGLFTIDRDENNRPLSRVVKRCLNCNWPFNQSGSIHGSLAGARTSGQVKPTRQLVNHTVEVVGGPGQGAVAYAPQPSDGRNYV